jgi:Thrombospondin type 3 repeat
MNITRFTFFACMAFAAICNTSCLSKKITAPQPIVLVAKDTDGDGINDTDDKCPDVKGVAALQGCPDRDGDGIADKDDKCPDTIGLARLQGCPIPDTDKDRINDEEDKCPTVFGYARYQGCPVPDSDGDGINDEEDKCRDLPGPESNKGCPLPTEDNKAAKKDSDGDGVPDADDNCMHERGPASNHGCPVAIKNKKSAKKDSDGDGIIDSLDSCPFKKGSSLNYGCPLKTPVKTKPSVTNQSTTDALTHHKKNRVVKTVKQDATISSASIDFTYRTTMAPNETNDLLVNVIMSGLPVPVVKKINNADRVELPFLQKNDTCATCIVPVIEKYTKLKISVLYDKTDFEIIPADTEEEQELDFIKGKQWHWKIRPLGIRPHTANIALLINAETPEGFKYTIAKKEVTVKILPGRSDSSSPEADSWINSHLAYLVAGLLALTIIFLFATRRKKENKPGGNKG